MYAQGSATIAQGVVKANVWAKNAVSLSSGLEVFADATSSTSSITLSNNSTTRSPTPTARDTRPRATAIDRVHHSA